MPLLRALLRFGSFLWRQLLFLPAISIGYDLHDLAQINRRFFCRP